jgi:hypothetical protein
MDMPFCPKCRDEFQDEVAVCPDCGVRLVERLAEEAASRWSKEPLAYLTTAPNESIGVFWQGILEDQGIKSMLKGGNLWGTFELPTFSISHDIYVLKSRLREAKSILKPFIDELNKPNESPAP